MNIKKFSICAIIIMSVIVVSCVVCCFIKIPSSFNFTAEPTSITVYDYSQSSTGKTVTKTNTNAEDYEKLFNEFKNLTNLSVFQRIISGANIYEKPSQDIKQEKPTWPTVKGGNVTIELLFKEKQSQVVYVDGYSKQIDFLGLAMVVSSNPFVHEVSLYYKTTTSGTYASSPILIQMDTNELNKIIKYMDWSK